MIRPNLIIFDMDGVIVDVSRSYRDTVRKTVELFFEKGHEADRLPTPLFSLKDLAAVKQAGGLNNDWELTYHVLALLTACVDVPAVVPVSDGWDLHEKMMVRCRVAGLGRFLDTAEEPLKNLHAGTPAPENGWIRSLSAGDVGSGNVIKQMFQEIYLGKTLFENTYGFSSRCVQKEGLIDREKLLLPVAFFKDLAAVHRLAIATGRPRSEAVHALERFDLQTCFETVMTLDECLADEQRVAEQTGRQVSLSKPHPYMLDAIAERCKDTIAKLFYIGDMPDDMMAAGRAAHECIGVGVTYSSPDQGRLKQTLMGAGADLVIDSADDLRKYLMTP